MMLEKWLDKITCADCHTILPQLPDQSIDLVVTDPPFGQGCWEGDIWEPEYLTWLDIEAKRLLQPTGSIYIMLSQARLEEALALLPDYRVLIWAKSTMMLHKYVNNWERACQPILHYRTNNSYFEKPPGLQAADWWSIPTTWAKSATTPKIHNAQKPLKLLKKMIRASCPINGVVLDPMAGSGSTGVAAKQLDRRYILVEKELDYCDAARKWLGRAQSPLAGTVR